MASPTKRTERIRKQKMAKKGRIRKRKVRKAGTTRTAKELFGD